MTSICNTLPVNAVFSRRWGITCMFFFSSPVSLLCAAAFFYWLIFFLGGGGQLVCFFFLVSGVVTVCRCFFLLVNNCLQVEILIVVFTLHIPGSVRFVDFQQRNPPSIFENLLMSVLLMPHPFVAIHMLLSPLTCKPSRTDV